MEWKLPPYRLEDKMLALAQTIDWGVSLLNVPEAWKQTQGEGVKVAVLDTGCHLTHVDLADAIIDASDFTGSRFGPADKNGHGTHCAGIVAARDNDTGVVGVAPKASLLVGKVLGDGGGGSSQSVAAGIYWAAEKGARVISMSLGSPNGSQQIREAIRHAVHRGCFVVVAAGNSGPGPDTVEYPGRWEECITVGAMNKDRRVSRFSSRGPQVTVVAPGESITSTWHQAPLATLSGTSMATPFVAGLVALIVAKHAKGHHETPVRSPAEMKSHLKRTATDMDAVGPDPNAGWGLVDPGKALGEERAQPGPKPAFELAAQIDQETLKAWMAKPPVVRVTIS